MNFLNLIKIAIKAIASNKFRSFLSMLGIIIGVAAVIIMMAIGQGSKERVTIEIVFPVILYNVCDELFQLCIAQLLVQRNA